MSKETELVLVETISMFRMRYVVEVPVGKSEWALDTVTCQEAGEVSQKHLDEVISSHRVLTEDEYMKLFDIDNDYLKGFTPERKRDFITVINKDKDKE
jgi:hypothetical protein